jgi:hypothetical protein
MLVSENEWAVIQQGLDTNIRKARRYHWISEGLNSFLEDSHNDIGSEITKSQVLDMSSKKSKECRKVTLDLVQEGSRRIKRYLIKLRNPNQKSLDDFCSPNMANNIDKIPHLDMPSPFSLKWESLDLAKELALNDYTELLKIRGLGPGMIRALALISEFIWGEAPSWQDPAKYAYAVGGKDGIPYKTNIKRMENCATILKEAIDQAKLERKEKINALKRLHKFKNKKRIFP